LQRQTAPADGRDASDRSRSATRIGVREWFPVIVGAEDTARGKPEPDVFLEAARRLAVSPSIRVVYEDTDIGLEAARRAGMRWVDIRRM
jgi:HAD superfamily hydrolase (TIGR01509 family)